MSGSVCLVVIYNHRHSANVEKLENLYRGRFSHVYHLMPFHEGGENVIPVYESAHCFQGHLAQGYDRYFAAGHRHYIFVADDLLLNPVISEENYMEYFGLDDKQSFIRELKPLCEAGGWSHIGNVFACNWDDAWKCDARNMLPTYDEALTKMEKLGLTVKAIPAYFLLLPVYGDRFWESFRRAGSFRACASLLRQKVKSIYLKWMKHSSTPVLPFVLAHSDFCIVSSKHVGKFIHYCGVFAAYNLFVEIALPTSLALCVEPEEIVMEKDLPSRGIYLWGDEKESFAKRHGMQLEKMLADFPEDVLYVHPVKPSQWK